MTQISIKSFLSRAELTQKQKQLDINQDGKISSDDLKKLRQGAKPGEASTVTAAPSQQDMIKFLASIGLQNPKKIAKGLFVDDENELAFQVPSKDIMAISDQLTTALGPMKREKSSKGGAVARIWKVKGKGRIALMIDPNTNEASLHVRNN